MAPPYYKTHTLSFRLFKFKFAMIFFIRFLFLIQFLLICEPTAIHFPGDFTNSQVEITINIVKEKKRHFSSLENESSDNDYPFDIVSYNVNYSGQWPEFSNIQSKRK